MFLRILFLIFLILSQQPVCLSQIPTNLNSFSFKVQNKQALPDDISFCIVDLKYKKPHLKICEFGQGVFSGFMGHSKLFGQGEIWKNLWPFLSSFKVPVFFINGSSKHQIKSLLKATKTLGELGGIVCSGFEELKKNKRFRTAMAHGKKNQNTTIAGVLVSSVEPGGAGDQANLRKGDVILEVNRKTLKGASFLRKEILEAKRGDVLLLYVFRSGSYSILALAIQ